MKNKLYVINGKTYLSHINDEAHLYGLLHQLAFLAGRIKDEEDVFHVLDTAKQYGEIAQQLRADGVTGALLHEAASITVTCFAKNLATYAEEIPFAQHGRKKHTEQTEGSGIYLLRPQYEDLYDPVLKCFRHTTYPPMYPIRGKGTP